MSERAAVVGAGSWGTALARHLASRGFPTRLWARDPEHAAQIQRTRENARYLPGITLPDALSASGSLAETLEGAALVVLAVPSHALRGIAAQAREAIAPGAAVINAAKGIENDTLQLMGEVLTETLAPAHHRYITHLSGPSFAREVARGMPTAVCIAGADSETTLRVQHAFNDQQLRCYRSDDVVGVELGGALKNVIAIAAGASDGLGFGYNSRAGLITRGLAEIGRLAIALGAHPLTVSGLSGMGDLVLTCTGDLSRNRHVGMELGKGRALPDILAEMTMVAEGVRTTRSAHALAAREGVEMPIVDQVHAVLYGGKDVREAVTDLMTRAPRAERD